MNDIPMVYVYTLPSGRRLETYATRALTDAELKEWAEEILYYTRIPTEFRSGRLSRMGEP